MHGALYPNCPKKMGHHHALLIDLSLIYPKQFLYNNS
jgi:hypothetical protein